MITMRRAFLVLAPVLLVGSASCSGQPEGRADSPPTAESTRAVSSSAAPSERAGNPPKRDGEIWSGRSGGFDITWSDDDLQIRGDRSGPPFSYAAGARSAWEPGEDESGESVACAYETKLRVLSVVGSIISVERSDYAGCPNTAHPSIETRYEAFDASSPETRVKLTNYFPAKDILAALLGDGIVKKALAELDVATPGTLDELIAALSESTGACEYSFTTDLLERFAFHHIEGGKVAVRIGLSHGAEPCRGMLTQIGILLPVSPSLAEELKGAESRRAGYLMRDIKQIAGERVMKISGGE